MNWLLILKIKSGQRPDGKRGPGSFACGGKDFSVLIFWLLLYQDKRRSPLEFLFKINNNEKSNSPPR